MKRVLLIIGGSYHDFAAFADQATASISRTGLFQVDVTEDRQSLCRLDRYDALMIYTQGGTLSDAQEAGLCAFVRGGGGLLGVHGAAASWQQNERYMELLGCRFAGHGSPAPLTVALTAEGREQLPRARQRFEIVDECYRLESTTDAPCVPLWQGTWEFEATSLGHLRPYGDGTVVYTALGHDERAWRHEDFQDLIMRGLLKVTGHQEGEPVRLGLVGYGPLWNMGRFHAERIGDTPGLAVTAVCDRDPARLEAARDELGELPTFTDAGELAASGLVDGAVLSLPHNAHATVGLPLLEAGLHVIMEKPFALTAAECDRMIEAAEARGTMLTVHHDRHWSRDTVTLRRLVRAGVIGQVFSITVNLVGYKRPKQEWRSHKPSSGGLLYDSGSHYLEKVFQLIPAERNGEPVNRRARAYGNFLKKVWHDVTNEDHCRAYLKFDTGLEVELIQSTICTAHRPRWSILGTGGSIETDGARETATVRVYEDGEITTSEVPLTGGDSRDFYRNVADHLHAGLPLVIPARWARNPIAAIDACARAAERNELVDVEFYL